VCKKNIYRLCNVKRLEGVISVALKSPLEITLGICIRHFCIDPMTIPYWFHTKLSPHILQQNCTHAVLIDWHSNYIIWWLIFFLGVALWMFEDRKSCWLLSLVKELVKSICPRRELIAVWIRLDSTDSTAGSGESCSKQNNAVDLLPVVLEARQAGS